MQRIITILIGLSAFVLAIGVGARFLLMPEATGAEMGLAIGSPLGGSTLRGDIGGAFVGLGLATVLGLVRQQPRYLEVVAICIAGVAVGRGLSLVIDGFDPTGLTGGALLVRTQSATSSVN